MRHIQKVRATFRLRGVSAVGNLLKENLWMTRRYHRLRLDLASWQPDAPCGVNGSLVVQRGRLEDLVAWRRRQSSASLAGDFFMDEVRGFEWFYLGYWDQDIAHISWIATPDKGSSIPGFRLRPGEVELRAALTRGGFRQRGIFGNVLAFVLGDLQASGIKTVLAHVQVGNTASLNRFLAAGFLLQNLVTFRRVAFLNWVQTDPAADLVGAR